MQTEFQSLKDLVNSLDGSLDFTVYKNRVTQRKILAKVKNYAYLLRKQVKDIHLVPASEKGYPGTSGFANPE